MRRRSAIWRPRSNRSVVYKMRLFGLLLSLAIGACGSPTPADDSTTPVVHEESDAAIAAAGFYCFSWVHDADYSTPCYRSRQSCDDAAADMKAGSRDVTVCEGSATAWCALVDDERCFETGSQCASYIGQFADGGKTLPSCQTRQ